MSGWSPCTKLEAKNRFSTTSRLTVMANSFGTKQGIVNRQGLWKVGRVPHIVSKFRELLPTNGLKLGRGFYWPLVFCSVHSPSHTAALTWRPTATSNKTALGLSVAQFNWSSPNFVRLIRVMTHIHLPIFVYKFGSGEFPA